MADTILSMLILIPIPGMVYNQIDVYIGILSLLIVAAIGTYAVYLSNGGNNGHEFLPRFLSLGWVAGIRYTVLVFLPLFIVYLIFILPSSEDSEIQSTWFDAVAVSSLYIGFFWILSRHMKGVARLKQGENQTAVTA